MADWKKIEALLFASGKYLTEEQLTILAKIPKNKIKKALSDLQKHYEEKDTSLKIFNEKDAWKLNVKEEYTEVIREVVSDAEMPRAVMETLAVIAYKSPVLQSEIKDIRGTTVYDHIPLLETKGFITREKHGRSYKIKLTNKFHEYFDTESDSKMAELFKDIKKPEAPEKLGNLEVYDEDNKDEEFTEQILERMKKLEKTKEDHTQENNFLNEFDEKFEKTKKNIDESEQEIETFRKKTDEDTKQIFDKEEQENDDKENDDDETDEDTKQIFDNDDSESDNEEKDIPEFLKKVNKQIDELTRGREEKKQEIEQDEADDDETQKQQENDEEIDDDETDEDINEDDKK